LSYSSIPHLFNYLPSFFFPTTPELQPEDLYMMHFHKCEKLQSHEHTHGYFGANYWKLP